MSQRLSVQMQFRPQWRRLLWHMLIGCAITGAVCAIAIWLGFGLRIGFFLLLAAVLSAALWLVRDVIRPASEVADQVPVLDVVHLRSRNSDPRARKIEEYLYGSQPRLDLASPQLRLVIAGLVESRLAAGEDLAARSPRLHHYLHADPAPALDRREIRRMIKEISAL